MKFELCSDKAKAAEPPLVRADCLEFEAAEGSTVCYHQPLYEQPLARLQSAIHKGASLSKLSGRFYKIQSNCGYLHQYYPAVEYYKIACRMIRDNIHTISFARDDMRKFQKEIEDIHSSRKEKLPGGQTKITFDKELYRLRSSLTTYVFSVRATLDMIASIFQTIYGPQIGQHISFNGLRKHLLGGKCAIDDPILERFLKDDMEWFVLLRDVRDYLAHFGAVRFSIKESSAGTFSIEIFRGMKVESFLEAVDSGFGRLLEFMDTHGSKVAADDV
jgi:hypothetical protein